MRPGRRGVGDGVLSSRRRILNDIFLIRVLIASKSLPSFRSPAIQEVNIREVDQQDSDIIIYPGKLWDKYITSGNQESFIRVSINRNGLSRGGVCTTSCSK